jgi:hypothetical protein
MQYQDRVYGKINITQPVVLELIESPTFERLKQIDMAGYFEPHFPGTAHSRFEHSLGVFCLLKKYGAPLEEQIAGLIHDVSHSAFSHCIDYIAEEGSEKEQDHQDNVFEDFVRNSEIPSICGKHGIDIEYVLDDRNFPLKERDLPDLCADRLDYSLRGFMVYEKKEPRDIQDILDHLIVDERRWVFKDFKHAQAYASFFKTLNDIYYSGPPTAVMFLTLSDYIKHALKSGYIDMNDMYTTDKEVLQKIDPYRATDPQLQRLFDRMNLHIACSVDSGEGRRLYCKSRAVDPLCYHEGAVQRVSDIDAEWGKIVQEDRKPKEYILSFGE